MANFPAGGVNNILLLTDSYKITHHRQYPPNTSHVYSYFESRGGKFPYTVFFGLQYVLKRWLVGKVLTEDQIIEAAGLLKAHFGDEVFNEEGWRYILKEHKGRIPLRVKAVPEGSVVPNRNVLFTVENTDPKCGWLTNYFETLFVQCWYPSTVATNSRAQKELIGQYLDETADSLDALPIKLHDFGYRGCTSVESAGIGGCAHLVNFTGTDTLAGLALAQKYYHCDMAGFSIPAAEHSTMTTWGKAKQVEAFRNMLTQFPKGAVAVVSDSYDVFHACDKLWGVQLKDQVIARGERGGLLVIRPDSGDPASTVLEVLEILGRRFGTTVNKKGYKMLPPYLRVIQGDSISYETLPGILETLKDNEWSTDNLVFGSGGALLQRLDRDTQKFAFKCCHAVVNDKGVDVYKDPITDPGKKSKKGRLILEFENNTYTTKQMGEGDPAKDQLVTIFENGELLVDYTLDEIRARAEIDLVKNKS